MKLIGEACSGFQPTLSVNSLLAYFVISFFDWPITPAMLLYSSPTCNVHSSQCETNVQNNFVRTTRRERDGHRGG